MKQLKGVEFFAGSRSVGKVAEFLGMTVFSIDWQPFPNINYVGDIEYMNISDIPFIPDWGWFSPDCKTYSIASVSKHRINAIHPKSEYAIKCDRVNQHFIQMIDTWIKINPNFIYFIENPRGMLRKMPFMQKFKVQTVWYCQYGDNRAKPTDIWTNCANWVPRPICKNGNTNCHHEKAIRGSKTGTNGRKDSFERSKIPTELCIEVIQAIQKTYINQ
jgi:hypothetical protein